MVVLRVLTLRGLVSRLDPFESPTCIPIENIPASAMERRAAMRQRDAQRTAAGTRILFRTRRRWKTFIIPELELMRLASMNIDLMHIEIESFNHYFCALISNMVIVEI